MNYKISKEAIQAAQSILAATTDKNRVGSVGQVHEIILRSEDPNEDPDKFPLLHIVPIGPVIGFAISRKGEPVKDEDYIFVSAKAVAAAIPAMGFTVAARPTELFSIVSPRE